MFLMAPQTLARQTTSSMGQMLEPRSDSKHIRKEVWSSVSSHSAPTEKHVGLRLNSRAVNEDRYWFSVMFLDGSCLFCPLQWETNCLESPATDFCDSMKVVAEPPSMSVGECWVSVIIIVVAVI